MWPPDRLRCGRPPGPAVRLTGRPAGVPLRWPQKRILIAGVGNLLRGDDGFGIRVIHKLSRQPLPPGVEIYEAGSAGVALAQKLMDGFDACLIVDAIRLGGPPRIRLLPDAFPAAESPRDRHAHPRSLQDPGPRASHGLPAPKDTCNRVRARGNEDLSEQLLPAVEAAVEPVVAKVLQELERPSTVRAC